MSYFLATKELTQTRGRDTEEDVDQMAGRRVRWKERRNSASRIHIEHFLFLPML